MRRIIIAITSILLTFIGVTFAVSAIILNSDKILNSFSIISVDNVSSNFTVNFEKVKAAKYYDVVVYNEDNIEIFSKTVYKTNVMIELNRIEYDSKYKMVIYAYDKLGDSISVVNPYTFTYTEPTFSSDNSLVLNDDEDYKLIIDGNLTKKNYLIRLSDNGYKLKEEKITTNEYVINKSFFAGLEQKLDIEIIDGVTSIDSISLYNKISPVSDITITSPANGNILDYNDVSLIYNGGDNATQFLVQIYKGKDLIRETTVRKNRCVISSDLFEKAESYKIKINAKYKDYEDYTKTSEVEFTMNEKDTLKPTYINFNPKYVKSGSNIVINNPNPDGNIYYTTNGSDPMTNGIKYTGPLVVNENMLLKTIIMEPNKNNSIISEYDINVGIKDKYSVYLSPSNQDGNFGVRSTGYTNEMKEMNDLSNYIEKRLKSAGVKVYRNSSFGNINLWTSDSKYYGVDLHLAIHSNASTGHNIYGIETWINEESSKTYSLAHLIQNALINIYYNEEPEANRGVKYANGSLGEVNELAVPFGILLEIAHHDYEKDAAWIMQNKELIANTISDTILKYFGIL